MQKNFGIPQNNEKLEEILDNKPKDRNDPKDGTKWLEDIFKRYFVLGYSYLGHGTPKECSNSIVREGLYSSDGYLQLTTYPLCDCRSPAMGECIDKILNWPHRNYKCIVIVAIPNPKLGEKGGLHYFNSVFEELEENKKIDIGIQGADRSYKIPEEFLVGYIDVKSKCFVENPRYNPNAEVVFKPIQGRTIGSEGKHKYDPEKSGPVISPEKYTEPEVF